MKKKFEQIELSLITQYVEINLWSLANQQANAPTLAYSMLHTSVGALKNHNSWCIIGTRASVRCSGWHF